MFQIISPGLAWQAWQAWHRTSGRAVPFWRGSQRLGMVFQHFKDGTIHLALATVLSPSSFKFCNMCISNERKKKVKKMQLCYIDIYLQFAGMFLQEIHVNSASLANPVTFKVLGFIFSCQIQEVQELRLPLYSCILLV